MYVFFSIVALYAVRRRRASSALRSRSKNARIRTVATHHSERCIDTSILRRFAGIAETTRSTGSWRLSTVSRTITLTLSMKLGMGPTSMLYIHFTFNDTTALRLFSGIISFHENMSFVANETRWRNASIELLKDWRTYDVCICVTVYVRVSILIIGFTHNFWSPHSM